jgi:hypothetical protein
MSLNAEVDFRSLSGGEKAVLAKLLGADFPGNLALREQLPRLRARKIDGDGSLSLLAAHSAIPAEVACRIPVEAELEDVDGMTIHVLLHIMEGLMSELEIYRDDSSPVKRGIEPDDLRLIVL